MLASPSALTRPPGDPAIERTRVKRARVPAEPTLVDLGGTIERLDQRPRRATGVESSRRAVAATNARARSWLGRRPHLVHDRQERRAALNGARPTARGSRRRGSNLSDPTGRRTSTFGAGSSREQGGSVGRAAPVGRGASVSALYTRGLDVCRDVLLPGSTADRWPLLSGLGREA
ncbi:hypothetical protein ACIBI3_02080 [Actinomadura luteofluorescens]|uniref:hypothetical protein n=1 Tax=Actinomadura luteofluorescens TaxID=46163 RepID=UPI0037A2CEFB